ncbi:hypothetical protein HX867_09135 [Pseudomonas gingeri]|uniref:hypothetical protein n=1 Tax=Pseudomonas gingeri TaxID=117681 RepID=UPI0015A2F384|nr:hypothetical protein [Pseudomonas gingeri]NVZ62241.1 hypothetical protein [Pseudomonas gingeri]NVZ74690.1 hypothetical protein [Pseudomonas gingeri]NWA10825.1 hypothetical protein [Pseudomonas gingeri]
MTTYSYVFNSPTGAFNTQTGRLTADKIEDAERQVRDKFPLVEGAVTLYEITYTDFGTQYEKEKPILVMDKKT